MRFATSSAVVLTASTVLAAANPAVLIRRQDCQQGYSSCAPQGATTSALPPVGTALASLYSNLLDTAKNAPADSSSSRKARRDGGAGVFARDAPSMCCESAPRGLARLEALSSGFEMKRPRTDGQSMR